MKKKEDFGFLSDRGIEFFNRIKAHCEANKILFEIDELELAMLANSFDLYATNAALCRDDGSTQSPKGGGWDQVRPEYTIMKNEYQNILKHSPKFGLNPGDRARIFGGMKAAKKTGFVLK